MKRLPLICFAAAFLLLGLGLWSHHQTQLRNEAARALHERQLAWQSQQAHDLRLQATEKLTSAIKTVQQDIKSREQLAQEIRDTAREAASAALWRDVHDSIRARSLTDAEELELIRAQADKDRGF